MRVVAIDPAVKSNGFAVFDISDEHPFGAVVACDMVDFTRYGGWSRHITDRVADFLERDRFGEELRAADAIVIEQQPPKSGGETSAALIYSKFPGKVHWVSPVRFQRVNHISHLDYDERKEWAVATAAPHARALCSDAWEALGRKHDVADAINLGMHWIQSRIARPNRFQSFRCGAIRSRFFP